MGGLTGGAWRPSVMRIGTLGLAAMALLIGTAQAVEPTGAVSRRVVSFGDLDLKLQDDVAVLYSRIQDAGRTVCDQGVPVTLDAMRRTHQCARDAVGRAVADVDSATLTAYH